MTERPGAPLAHPATLIQPRAIPRGVGYRGSALQRMMGVFQKSYTGTDPKDELRDMGIVFRDFAKVANGNIQEVQAMWYAINRWDEYSLAVSANASNHDQNAVDAIATGIATTLANQDVHPAQAIVTARAHLYGRAHATWPPAQLVRGQSHAEQNLLAWIAQHITADSTFIIAGSKDPCTQCLPKLTAYRQRLIARGYLRMFTFLDGGQNQVVPAQNLATQVDPAALRVP